MKNTIISMKPNEKNMKMYLIVYLIILISGIIKLSALSINSVKLKNI